MLRWVSCVPVLLYSEYSSVRLPSLLRPRNRLTFLPAFIVLLSLAVVCSAQAPSDTIRGRITGPNGAPIAGASIHVTRAPDRTTQATTTGNDGTFSVVFSEGTGDYLVHVAAPTFEAFRKRATGVSHNLVVDAQLSPGEATLPVVVVYGSDTRPDRDAVQGVDVGASEAFADGVRGATPALERGNVAALAAITPGVIANAGGISALGLPASQSQITLNGLAFAGTSVPRDAAVRTRVSTSTYDPARGGFASADVALELAPGGVYSSRSAHATWEPFALQISNRNVAALGGRYSAADVGIGGDGELVRGRLYYSASGELTRRATPVPTLDRANLVSLRAYGLAPDSVSAILSAASALGIPLLAAGSRPTEVETNGTILFRLDHTPAANSTWSIGGYFSAAENAPLELSPLASQAHSQRERAAVSSLTGAYSFFTKANRLNETRVVVSRNDETIRPLLHYPDITVNVISQSADSALGATPIFLGADNSLSRDARLWTIQGINQTIANISGSSHRLKLAAESRFDLYRVHDASNSGGAFTFPSLSALNSGTPGTFIRSLSSPRVSGGNVSNAISLGDYWQATPTLQLIYGLRLEGERFLSRAPLNPVVQSDLHARTDASPSSVGVSPRLGVTWFYGGGDNSGGNVRNALGSFSQRGTAGSFRGGIGEFRSRTAATLLADAQQQSGAPGSELTVTCVGADAPSFQWSAMRFDPGATPSNCVFAGDHSTAFPIRSVRILDPDFKPARSWRSNLAWTGAARRWIVSAEGIYSLNLDQLAHQDINFSSIPAFTLANEGSRPVYAPPESIDRVTGAVPPNMARRSARLNSVIDISSGARSVSKQLVVSIAPQANFSDTRYYSISYALSRTVAQLSGIDGTTFTGQPGLEWMVSPNDVMHQLLVQGGLTIPHVGVATVFGRLASGRPYTPIVDADVNGDGFVNDRAFVGVSAPGDATLQQSFARLLSSAPSNARSCLLHTMGKVATPNGCRSGWTQTVNAQLSLSNGLLHLSRRSIVSIQVNNVLAGIDRSIHGAGHLSGWGAPGDVDPILYHVRGYDPAVRQFAYVVNPNFGSPRGTTSILANPFRVTLDVSLDLGVPLRAQLLERALSTGRNGDRGPRSTPKQIQTRYTRSIPDIYSTILFNSDSLLLSSAQVEALDSAHVVYRAAIAPIWAELANRLASLGDRFDPSEALNAADDATKRVWDIVRRQTPFIQSILSPLQLSMLPQMARTIMVSPTPIRISTGS